MKLLSFKKQGISSFGVIIGKNILDIREAIKKNLEGVFSDIHVDQVPDMIGFLNLGERGLKEIQKVIDVIKEQFESEYYLNNLIRIDEVTIQAPIPRPKKGIVCLGFNYRDHVKEGGKTLDKNQQIPEHPIFFTKAPTSINGPYDNIIYPRITEKLDYEVELALIIGKKGKYIAEENVYDHIAGYSVFNDVSARDLQTKHGQWYIGKSLDTFAPMGPYIVTPDEVGNSMNLDLNLIVNKVIRQKSNTSNLIFDIPNIVSTLSEGITLEVGDIIATGTPSGVGSAHELGFLKVGDIVEAQIENIGFIRNRIVSETT
jgi:2-keto-4-pentenoate hydratase/2-oxohepta-3-ene-1,7-dioic acid hydratase in catechol pathway